MSALSVWRADRVRRLKFATLAKDDRGSVAIMFALTIFVVFTLVGGAVDLGRAMVARERLQSAVDSSVLAAARVWQLENDLTLAEEKALAHFDTNKPVKNSSGRLVHPRHAGGDLHDGRRDHRHDTVPQSRQADHHGFDARPGPDRRWRQRGYQPRSVDDARHHGVDGRQQDRRSQGGGQGPDRHRRVGRPVRVHVARGAGAVLGRGQRRQRARPAGRLQSVVEPDVQAAQRWQQHALSDEYVLPGGAYGRQRVHRCGADRHQQDPARLSDQQQHRLRAGFSDRPSDEQQGQPQDRHQRFRGKRQHGRPPRHGVGVVPAVAELGRRVSSRQASRSRTRC